MENNTEQLELRIFRYDPESDRDPYYKTYMVPKRQSWSFLDALNYIKDELDGSLTYRWSCQMAICGSCGMMVDGKPALACKTFVRGYEGSVDIDPLAHFDIERDLVTEVENVFEKMTSLQTYLKPADPERKSEDGTRLQSPKEFKKYKQYSMCINCMLCYSACPQFGLNDAFLGPAALALTRRYNLDSRDTGKLERMDRATAKDGVWNCTLVGSCSEVCPKHVDPAGAIQEMKVEGVFHTMADYIFPGRRKRHKKNQD